MFDYADDINKFIYALRYGVYMQLVKDKLIDGKILYLVFDEDYEEQ